MRFSLSASSAVRQTTSYRLVNDWAVVRLDRPLDVTPYRISEDNPAAAIIDGTPVVSVIFSQDYLVLAADGSMNHPKTVSDCTVRDIATRGGRLVYFATDCDGAQRSSGGSVLSATAGVPTLIGIWAASNENRMLLDAAVARMVAAGTYRNDLANGGAYQVNQWSSRHVPVSGAFLEAINFAIQAAEH
jgi:hypothetical protein